MNTHMLRLAGSFVLVIALFLAPATLALAEGGKIPEDKKDVPRISKEEVKAILGDPRFIIIDVRGPDYLKPGEPLIAGAHAENPHTFDEWAGKYPKDKKLILACS